MTPPGADGRLRLKQLALVQAVAASGSLRRAAEALHMTQSAATKALKELEAVVGVPLFQRSSAGMVATPAGQMFVHNASAILGNVSAALEAARDFAQGRLGQVRVGALPAAALTLVPAAVVRLHESHPRLQIHLLEGSSDQLLRQLHEGTLDLVVGRLPEHGRTGSVEHEALYEEPLCLVCRPGHPLLRRGTLGLADLASAEWVLPEEPSHVRRHLGECFARAGMATPQPALVTSSPMTRIAVLEGSDMLGVLAQRAAVAVQARGLLVCLPVELPGSLAPVGFSVRRDELRSPATQAFIGALRDAVAAASTAAA